MNIPMPPRAAQARARAGKERTMPSTEDLIGAIRGGDAARVRAILRDEPALAAARDPAGVSLPLLALYHRRQEVAEALLEANPPLDVFDAAALGQVERLRALLAADPGAANAWAADGFFPLGLACFFGRPAAVRVLLDAGADVRAAARNPMRVTGLHAAAAARATGIARMLLERGAEVDARQQAGYTALHAAARHGDEELVDLLLAHGADPSLRSDDGKDAAAHARDQGHDRLADRLQPAARPRS
jgi:adenosylhomocysteine nucleosidase